MGEFFGDNGLPSNLGKLFARSSVSLTIADLTKPDCPLIGVNQQFCDLTGYDAGAVLGKNCRFLQPHEGAGPVRGRMRAFLADPTSSDARFLLPNQRRDGSGFVNLVYLSKLTRDGKSVAVLGSQFAVGGITRDATYLYDRALTQDLQRLTLIAQENNLGLLGSFAALASSHSIIAQARLSAKPE